MAGDIPRCTSHGIHGCVLCQQQYSADLVAWTKAPNDSPCPENPEPLPAGYSCWVEYWDKNPEDKPDHLKAIDSMEWFHALPWKDHFEGKYVAVVGKKIVAVGYTAEQVLDICKSGKHRAPFITRVGVEDPKVAYFGL